jgi:predicted DNA-binding antitoxin AbrB/MazE fold protein
MTIYAVLFIAASVCSAATPVDNFKITSGISEGKTSEITFNSTRVISGTAEKGSQVTITVNEPYTTAAGTTAYNTIRSYTLTVGNTGIFSQSISLKEGKNYVIVAATKDDKYSEAKTTINRKNKVLRTVLSQSIAVPGSSGW